VQRPKPRRAGRQLKLFERATPDESVQVDVKVVKIGGTKADQYTACDDCTRLRVLRLCRRLGTLSSLDFLSEHSLSPSASCKPTVAPSSRSASCSPSSGAAFAVNTYSHVAQVKNGKVERSHRVDAEEFWGRSTFATFELAGGCTTPAGSPSGGQLTSARSEAEAPPRRAHIPAATGVTTVGGFSGRTWQSATPMGPSGYRARPP
jgi:hypothetical protein